MLCKKKFLPNLLLIGIIITLLTVNCISAASIIGPIIPIEPINPGIILPEYTYIIEGTVKDDKNNAVAGATIKISYTLGTAKSTSTSSDTTGRFTKTITSSITPITSGWSIEVSKTGYNIKSQTTSYSTGSKGESVTTVNVVCSILTYTISLSVTGGQCTISPTTPHTVEYGKSVTFTITPSSGYKLKAVTIDGSPATLSGDSLSFTSVTSDHSIGVEMEAETNWLLYGGIAAVVIIAAIVIFLKTRKPAPPKPTGLRLSSNKPDLPADGRTNAELTIELLDKDDKPMKATEDTVVSLMTSSGTLKAAEFTLGKKDEAGVEKVRNMFKSDEVPTGTQVLIKKDQSSSKATVISSKEIGPVKIEATSKGLTSATLTINFTEKRRFCMHCGAAMKLDDTVCPKCGKAPPSDVDVKECMNCKTVIPKIAKFCSECGASQPQ